MPLIKANGRVMQDGTKMIQYTDTVGPSYVTYTLENEQELLVIVNKGVKPITFTVGTTTATLNPGQSQKVETNFTSFQVKSSEGVQQFEVRMDEVGTVGAVGGADPGLSKKVSELSAELAQKPSYDETRLKIEKLELEDMSETTLAAIEGGAGTSFDLLSIPQNDSVTDEKLSPKLRNDLIFPVKNMLKNSGFENDSDANGLSDDWYNVELSLFTRSEDSKTGTYSQEISGSTTNFGRIRTLVPAPASGEYVFYASVWVKSVNEDVTDDRRINIQYLSAVYGDEVFNISSEDGWVRKSSVSKIQTSGSNVLLNIYNNNGSNSNSNITRIDGALLINLTETFGAGLEPSLEEMDGMVNWFDGTINLFGAKKVIEQIKSLSKTNDKLTKPIANTTQKPVLENGVVTKIQHVDNITSAIVREDVFTYTSNLITEVRKLSTGESLTFKHHLDTFETEVI